MAKKPSITILLIASAFFLLFSSCTVRQMTDEEASALYEKAKKSEEETRASKEKYRASVEEYYAKHPEKKKERQAKLSKKKRVSVITGIFVKRDGQCPQGYHGLVNGKTASKTDRHFTDVNTGIGGDTVGICAEMKELSVSSSRKVLTGITVSRWSNWKVKCPQGYVPAAGEGGGKLTMRTKNSCWRQGLCVRWTPLKKIKKRKELDHLFVSDLFLKFSKTIHATEWLPPGWKRAGLDIHRGCGGKFVFLLARYKGLTPKYDYNTMSDVFNRYNGPLNGETKKQYLKRVARDLAPIIYLHPGEKFYPSSLEFFFQNVNLINAKKQKVAALHQKVPLRPKNLAAKNEFKGHFLDSKQKLSHESATNPAFFRGQNPSQVSVPVYTIISKKSESITDIVYYLFFPYNRGKRVCIGFYTEKVGCAGGYSTFGNHVGDWEHMTIRLENNRPTKIFMASHDTGILVEKHSRNIAQMERVPFQNEFRGTHPIVYSALGSHGLYHNVLAWKYKHLPTNDWLVDYTKKGVAWNTWENLKIYGIYRPSPENTFSGEWTWLNYKGRWGNPRGTKSALGYYVLEPGPTFPKAAINTLKLQ